MKLIPEIDITKIRSGDSNPLTQIFTQCYTKSLNSIISVMKCKKEDAEDVLMDSIISLRDAIVDNRYRNENVGAYLTTVAINKLKKASGNSLSQSPKAEQIISCISKLKDKCKLLLTRNLIDGVSLNFLTKELGYKSYDVVKTSKARCMNGLRQLLLQNQGI